MIRLPAAAIRVGLHSFMHEGRCLVEVLLCRRVLEVEEVVREEVVVGEPLVRVVLQQPH